MEGSHVIVIQFKQHSHFGYKGKRFHAAGWGGGHAVLKRVSPWSAGVKVFLLCFSESERFPCPDRSALNRQTEQVPVSESAAGGTGRV